MPTLTAPFPTLLAPFPQRQKRDGDAPSWYNPLEAATVVQLLTSFVARTGVVPTEVGVICTYRRQVQKARGTTAQHTAASATAAAAGAAGGATAAQSARQLGDFRVRNVSYAELSGMLLPFRL